MANDTVTAYIAEVVADNSGKWCGNGLVFRTETAAGEWVDGLARRWTLVQATRVRAVEVDPTTINQE
jgi:hypothetical protein